MSNVRAIWFGEAPPFPPVDQHPAARRFGPITLTNGQVVYVDALGPQPSAAEIEAALPAPSRGPGWLVPASLGAPAKLDQHLQSAIAEFSAPAPEPAPESKPAMTQSPASHALTIKTVLEGHAKKLDEILQAQLTLLQTELGGQLDTVVKGTDAVISQVRGHTDDFKAILGQFTNDL